MMVVMVVVMMVVMVVPNKRRWAGGGTPARQGRTSSSHLSAASSIGRSPQGLDCKVFSAPLAFCRSRRDTTGRRFSFVGRVPVPQLPSIGCPRGNNNRRACPEKTWKPKCKDG